MKQITAYISEVLKINSKLRIKNKLDNPFDIIKYIITLIPSNFKILYSKKPQKASSNGDYVIVMYWNNDYYGEDNCSIWCGYKDNKICIQFSGSCKSKTYSGKYVNKALLEDKYIKNNLLSKSYSLMDSDKLPIFYDKEYETQMSIEFIEKYTNIIWEVFKLRLPNKK